MEKIKLSMDECQQRWMEMESLFGFSITSPLGKFNLFSIFYFFSIFLLLNVGSAAPIISNNTDVYVGKKVSSSITSCPKKSLTCV